MKAEHPSEMIFATFGLSSMPICFPLQPSLAEQVSFTHSSNTHASYMQEDLPTSPYNEVVMNVFGATAPRQCSSSIDNNIFNLLIRDNVMKIHSQTIFMRLNYKPLFNHTKIFLTLNVLSLLTSPQCMLTSNPSLKENDFFAQNLYAVTKISKS